MKQTSGTYSEIELIKSDSAQDEDKSGAENGLKLNSHEWDQNVQKLAAIFGGAKNSSVRHAGLPTAQIKTGVLSSLQEDDERYYATAILAKTSDLLKLATVEWRKEPLDPWRARAQNQMSKVMAAPTTNYTLPPIPDEASGCIDDTWTATSTTGRANHTAVWTGTEMIVWGGVASGNFFNTGGRYNPGSDSWTATSTTNAPSARDSHTAVWTGSEMIVWGGLAAGPTYFNTGGRYCAQSGATATPTATTTPTATATATATTTPTASGTPSATPTSSPTATARPTPTPRSRPTPAPRP
jgi:hypothetical protein